MCRVLTVNISLKKSVNMFEHMEISETMYEGVVEPSDKNLLRNMKTVMVTVEKK